MKEGELNLEGSQENKPQEFDLFVQKLDSSVLAVLGAHGLGGFQKAHVISKAIGELTTLLTDDYMKPIMALQGNRLGFRTDKDKTGGYGVMVVRNCLIEAVLMGLQPTGNQFNIIAGNTYPTKEGCGYLLNNFPGLDWDIVCRLTKINPEKTSAEVEATITWTLNGNMKNKTIPIPIKMDSFTSVDALIGKATRKARAWLLSVISGTEVTDGDATDVTYVDVTNTTQADYDELLRLFAEKRGKLSEEDAAIVQGVLAKKEEASYKQHIYTLKAL